MKAKLEAMANVAVIVVALAAGPTLTTVDFPGAVGALGTDINDSGQIVGQYTFSGLGDRQGFLLSDRVFTSISYPGGQNGNSSSRRMT